MKPPSGLAILLSAKKDKGDDDREESEEVTKDYDDELADLLQEFESAKELDDRVAALKTFVQMCMD